MSWKKTSAFNYHILKLAKLSRIDSGTSILIWQPCEIIELVLYISYCHTRQLDFLNKWRQMYMLFLSWCCSRCNPLCGTMPEQKIWSLLFCFHDIHSSIFLLLHKWLLQTVKQYMGGSSWLVLIWCVARNLIVKGTTAAHNFMFVQQHVIKIDVIC